MLRIGATTFAFYYFRDFSAEKPTPRLYIPSVRAVGSMIDRWRERGRFRRCEIDARPIAACRFRYMRGRISENVATWLAWSRSESFTSRFFPRYAREETHRSCETPFASCITVSLNFPRRDEARYLLRIAWIRSAPIFFAEICRRTAIVFNSFLHEFVVVFNWITRGNNWHWHMLY